MAGCQPQEIILSPITSVVPQHEALLAEVRQVFAVIAGLAATPPSCIEDGMRRLATLRAQSYEHMNQMQHEYLLLQAIDLLGKQLPQGAGTIAWHWNPRQTGGALEPDLQATIGDTVVFSVEATTSPLPKGSLNARMRDTLHKLSAMAGRQIYVVRTAAMQRAALTKVVKQGWNIEVLLLQI